MNGAMGKAQIRLDRENQGKLAKEARKNRRSLVAEANSVIACYFAQKECIEVINQLGEPRKSP